MIKDVNFDTGPKFRTNEKQVNWGTDEATPRKNLRKASGKHLRSKSEIRNSKIPGHGLNTDSTRMEN